MPAFQVTLTLADTNYNALTLVRAIDSAFVDYARRLTLQSEPTNTAGKVIFVGHEATANFSASRFGFKLDPGDPAVFEDPDGRATLAGLIVRSDAAGQKLNIDIAR